MTVKDFKMMKKITNLMTKTWTKVTKTSNFNLKKTIAISLLETILLKKISDKVKRKKINYHLLKRKIFPIKTKKNHSKKPSKWSKYPIMVESISVSKE